MIAPAPGSPLCVVFDLDGTLVDSEPLGFQALQELVPQLDEPVEALMHRYRGWGLAPILADVERRIGCVLPADFVARYRQNAARLFDLHLRPIAGADAMLDALPFARCIASGGPREKIERSLELCGLTRHFGEHVFSSYDIDSWKPEPTLFLHAARAMGYRPDRCVVVEDSDVGIAAAHAAGMRALRYVGADASVEDDRVPRVTDLMQLPDLLRTMATPRAFAGAHP